jgi:phosphatidylglycerophosphate synthase
MTESTRQLEFLLAGPERRLLRAIAARLPARVNSDMLTALGVLGALLTGAAFALSAVSPWWLFAAIPALGLNWFGDSLDGTLARVRHHERPRYGYYLDHIVDAFATLAVGLGLGLSPFVELEVALLLVVAYLGLSINVYLESAVLSVFRLAYGRIGPTEARILLAAGTAVLGVAALRGAPLGAAALCANGITIALSIAMVGVLGARCAGNLRRLAALEPPLA